MLVSLPRSSTDRALPVPIPADVTPFAAGNLSIGAFGLSQGVTVTFSVARSPEQRVSPAPSLIFLSVQA